MKSGIFIVYLFKADFSGVYLSLSQDTASKKEMYGLAGSREYLKKQAKLYRNLVSENSNFDISQEIDLALEVIPRDPSGVRTAKRLVNHTKLVISGQLITQSILYPAMKN